MLERVFPAGTIINEIIIEKNNPAYSLGRPLGSYPITVKIPSYFKKRAVLNEVIVLSHSERTVNALPFPVDFEKLNHKELSLIPGISKKTATKIILNKKTVSAEEQIKKISDLNNLFKK